MVPFKGLFAIFLALTLTNTANAGPAENVDEKGLSTKSSRDKRKNDSGLANQYHLHLQHLYSFSIRSPFIVCRCSIQEQ